MLQEHLMTRFDDRKCIIMVGSKMSGQMFEPSWSIPKKKIMYLYHPLGCWRTNNLKFVCDFIEKYAPEQLFMCKFNFREFTTLPQLTKPWFINSAVTGFKALQSFQCFPVGYSRHQHRCIVFNQMRNGLVKIFWQQCDLVFKAPILLFNVCLYHYIKMYD